MNISQGMILRLDLDPTKGHEQAGKRPVVVISNADYYRLTGMLLICPITNTDRGVPFQVKLSGIAKKTTGVVMTEQIRMIDPGARTVTVVEQLPKDISRKLSNIVFSMIETG